MRKSWALLVLVVLGGCDLYFGGGDDDPPCKDYGYGTGEAYPAQELRNPYDGTCQYVGGGYPCDGTCGPCAYEGDIAANPNWGSCYSQCEGLSENSCIQSAGCFAAYLDDPTADGKRDFYGCWQTAPSGPIHGTCTGLDAQTCSEHDDCSAQYTKSTYGLQFAACVPEYGQGACTGSACAPGYHCEEQCYGDPSTNMMDTCQGICVQDLTCASVDCGPGYTCSEVCTQDGNGKTTCHPACVTSQACESLTDEATCQNRSDCTPVYAGTDCTCTINGCTCQNLTYERCETL